MDENKIYIVFDGIRPWLRYLVSVLLIGAGFLLQIATKNILIGMPFVIACVVLNLLKGPSIKRVHAQKLEWQEVTPEKISDVLMQCKKIVKFRSQNAGCIIFGLAGIIFFAVFGMPLLLPLVRSLSFSVLAAIINAVILFGGLALSGRKSAWMPQGLDIKIEIVKRMIESKVLKKDPLIQIIPYLEIGKTNQGSFPNDTRLFIKFKDVTKDFIGLQGQISINTVKGRAYPYFYTVLIAKPTFGLFDKIGQPDLKKIVVERKKTSDMDILVIRQQTTKTSGYHTDTAVQDYTLKTAIDIARKMLDNSKKS